MKCNVEVRILNGLSEAQLDVLDEYPTVSNWEFSMGILTITLNLNGLRKKQTVAALLSYIGLEADFDYNPNMVLIYEDSDPSVVELGDQILELAELVSYGDRVAISEIETLISNYMNPVKDEINYEF